MYKRIAALALATLILTAAGCAASPDGTSATTPAETQPQVTTPAETTPPEDSNLLVIADEGAIHHPVLRAENAGERVTEAGAAIFRALGEATGLTPSISTDWARDLSTVDLTAPAIIVGDTNRPVCEGLIDSLEPRTFIIKVVDKQVVIAGATEKLTLRAAEYFIENFINNPEYCSNGVFAIPADLNVTEGPLEYEMTDLINYTDTYTSEYEKLFEISAEDGFRIMQGGCTDGTYCYFAMNDGVDQAYIYKYAIKDWSLVKRSKALPVDHSNDLCYNPDTGEIFIVHNAPNRDTISVLDPDTLELTRTFKIDYKIFSLAYCSERGMYVIGISGGQNFAFLDKDFKTIARHQVNSTGYTTQGVECDDDFIYFVQYKQNVIMVYDWDGGLVNRIDLTLPTTEPENISLVDGDFIIGCYNIANGSGGIVYRVIPVPVEGDTK